MATVSVNGLMHKITQFYRYKTKQKRQNYEQYRNASE